MYELYVKEKIETGLAGIEAGRTILHEHVKVELELLSDKNLMVGSYQK